MFFTLDRGGLEPTTPFGRFFANSIYLVGVITSIYALFMLWRPFLLRGEPATSEERSLAQKLVTQYGGSSLAHFCLLPDKSYYFTPTQQSTIAYVAKGRGVIALGDPISKAKDCRKAIIGFKKFCQRNDWYPAFYQTTPKNLDLYKSLGFKAVKIGEEAIVGALMPGAGKVEKISIVPRGVGGLGYTLQLPEEDRFLMIESEIRGRIATLLGGRSAEEIVFGEVSTGASDDIQKATDLAERAVTLYSMSDDFGPIAFEKVQQQFLEGYSNPRRSVSLKVAEEIDCQVKEIIDMAHQMALTILQQNRDVLTEAAQILLQKEILEGEELQQQLNRVQAPPELSQWLHTGKISVARHQLKDLVV